MTGFAKRIHLLDQRLEQRPAFAGELGSGLLRLAFARQIHNRQGYRAVLGLHFGDVGGQRLRFGCHAVIAHAGQQVGDAFLHLLVCFHHHAVFLIAVSRGVNEQQVPGCYGAPLHRDLHFLCQGVAGVAAVDEVLHLLMRFVCGIEAQS